MAWLQEAVFRSFYVYFKSFVFFLENSIKKPDFPSESEESGFDIRYT